MLNSFRKIYRFCIQADYEGKRTFKAVSSLLKNTPIVSDLLDIGCAEGAKTLEYAKLLRLSLKKVYGIEVSQKYKALAQKHFKVFNVDLEKDTFPFQDQELDLIICNQILEHLKNIYLPLSEIDRTLKIGGHLIIGIPNLAALHNRILILFGRQPLCNAINGPHIRCFTHKGFSDFIKSNTNFNLIKINAASLYPFPYPFVEYFAKYFSSLSSYTFYLLKKIKHNPVNCGWSLETDVDTNF